MTSLMGLLLREKKFWLPSIAMEKTTLWQRIYQNNVRYIIWRNTFDHFRSYSTWKFHCYWGNFSHWFLFIVIIIQNSCRSQYQSSLVQSKECSFWIWPIRPRSLFWFYVLLFCWLALSCNSTKLPLPTETWTTCTLPTNLRMNSLTALLKTSVHSAEVNLGCNSQIIV